MSSHLSGVSFPSEDVRHQFSSVKAYLEDEFLGEGTLCIAESQLVWALASDGTQQQHGVAIEYPLLTMHGIVSHDPKYPEEHLVVVVEKPKQEEDDDDDQQGQQQNGSDGDGAATRSDSPVEHDAIQTVNYRLVMASSQELKQAYQAIAECQALHPDPLDDVVEEDEVGSDIDYGNEDDDDEGQGEDEDPYGYSAHFASANQPARGSHGRRRGQNGDRGQQDNDDPTEAME